MRHDFALEGVSASGAPLGIHVGHPERRTYSMESFCAECPPQGTRIPVSDLERTLVWLELCLAERR